MKVKRFAASIAAACMFSSVAALAQQGFRQHDAHEHGTAQLNVAVDGNQLLIELSSPAANLVGFEHEPTSDEDIDQATTAAQVLHDASQMFATPFAANCAIDRVKVEMPWDLQGSLKPGTLPAEQHAAHEHDHGDHSDIEAEYSYTCGNPESLTELDMVLFQTFPATERVHVQYITATNQGSVELTTYNRQLRF